MAQRIITNFNLSCKMTRATQFIITYVSFTLSDWLVHTSVLINHYNWPHGVAFLFGVTLRALGGKSNSHTMLIFAVWLLSAFVYTYLPGNKGSWKHWRSYKHIQLRESEIKR